MAERKEEGEGGIIQVCTSRSRHGSGYHEGPKARLVTNRFSRWQWEVNLVGRILKLYIYIYKCVYKYA